MSKRYTLIAGDVEQEFARKEAAVAAGDRLGTPYEVKSPSGKVVHSTIDTEDDTSIDDLLGFTPEPTPTVASTQEPEHASMEDLDAALGGVTVEYLGRGLAKHFFAAMAEGVSKAFAKHNIDARVNRAEYSVTIFADDDADRYPSLVAEAWESAHEEFKAWKKAGRRAALYAEVREGRTGAAAEMYAVEQKYLTKRVSATLSGDL